MRRPKDTRDWRFPRSAGSTIGTSGERPDDRIAALGLVGRDLPNDAMADVCAAPVPPALPRFHRRHAPMPAIGFSGGTPRFQRGFFHGMSLKAGP